MSLWSIVGGLIEVGIASLGKEDAEKKAAQRYKDHSVSCRKCTGLAGPLSLARHEIIAAHVATSFPAHIIRIESSVISPVSQHLKGA